MKQEIFLGLRPGPRRGALHTPKLGVRLNGDVRGNLTHMMQMFLLALGALNRIEEQGWDLQFFRVRNRISLGADDECVQTWSLDRQQ